ncbi:unnamed protein product [Strongylus vulgaris]|uniref:RecQ-mediated genome instability protein 1 n=1 Tax=Strongylus vulgaris TaxID=40348 RepID=A0A3P7JUQ6_STRVU|nr:unnamed protein product [Strongylus vulgaris]
MYATLEESTHPIISQFLVVGNDSKTTLYHPVALQIHSIVDIGTPFHFQYTTLVYEFIDDTGFEPSPEMEREGLPDFCGARRRRMLMLFVGDGESNLKAIEYRRIEEFSLLTKPGCKFLLIPPVECRKGVLLLKPESVQVIGTVPPYLAGGDVESLFLNGRPLTVIAQRLNIVALKSGPQCVVAPAAIAHVDAHVKQKSGINVSR